MSNPLDPSITRYAHQVIKAPTWFAPVRTVADLQALDVQGVHNPSCVVEDEGEVYAYKQGRWELAFAMPTEADPAIHQLAESLALQAKAQAEAEELYAKQQAIARGEGPSADLPF